MIARDIIVSREINKYLSDYSSYPEVCFMLLKVDTEGPDTVQMLLYIGQGRVLS